MYNKEKYVLTKKFFIKDANEISRFLIRNKELDKLVLINSNLHTSLEINEKIHVKKLYIENFYRCAYPLVKGVLFLQS